MDREGADLSRVVASIPSRLNTHSLQLQLAIGAGKAFEGVVDVLTLFVLDSVLGCCQGLFGCCQGVVKVF